MAAPRNALRMATLRSLLVLLILIGLVCAATAVAQAPVEWYSESAGGGALAGPPAHLDGGGAVAPATAGPPSPGRRRCHRPVRGGLERRGADPCRGALVGRVARP